ncbi:MAG: VWA domain-containing protein, partial [Candidatus Thermoplasmatota archaeon]
YNQSLIGKYVFPVPTGAFISNFIMRIGNESYQAEVMNKSDARALFQRIVNESGEVSLLEYLDQNLLALEVAIPANSSIRMQICYEELLQLYAGLYRYVYTLSAERYSAQPIENVSILVNISASTGIANIYSPSHDITIERLNATNVIVKYSVRNSRPSRDFELYYTTTTQFVGAGILNYFDGEQGYLLFALSPSSEELNITYLPKDMIFVIDKSGSMSGEKIEQAKKALKYILQRLAIEDRFTIVSFDSTIYLFSDILREANATNINEALTYVSNIQAGGATNINDALLTAINVFRNSTFLNSTKIIVFLTDGLPTAGITNETQIAENIRNSNIGSEVCARIYTFGVGYDVNTHLLDRISIENYGITVYVKPGENLESALIEFYSKIAYPILTNITVEFAGIAVNETYPKVIPDLFKGSQIILLGKYYGVGNLTIFVNGSTAQGAIALIYNFTLNDTTYYNFIPRLWATRKIGELLDKVRLEGATEELISEIRALSFKYGIVTPYTSILIKAEEGTVTEGMEDVNAVYATTGNASVVFGASTWEYKSTTRAYITIGGNIITSGSKTFINLDGIFVESTLLGGITAIDLTNQTLEEWLATNILVNRVITFGSEQYFSLLNDEKLAEILSVGKELIFYYKGEIIRITERKPDLEIVSVEISNNAPAENDTVWFTVAIKNNGSLFARNIAVKLWVDNQVIESATCYTLRVSESSSLVLKWIAKGEGNHTVKISVDAENIIEELREDNNEWGATIKVVRSTAVTVQPVQPPSEILSSPIALLAFLTATAIIIGFFFGGTELGKYKLLTLLVVPLFTKLKKENILDHYTRGRIHGFIEANPGAHFNLIKRALGLNNGTLSYHLYVLEKNSLIKHSNDGFKERFYPIYAKIPKVPYLSKTEESILDEIKAMPGITQKELKLKLNLSQPLLSYYTTKLTELELLEAVREGKEIKYYLKEKGEGKGTEEKAPPL